MAAAVRVRGLAELNRDFRRFSGDISTQLVDGLKEAAEDVRTDAEQLALGRIRNMPRSPRWAGMKINVARGNAAVRMYPKARSRRRPGGGRSNLANLLLDRSMDPALEQNAAGVEKKVDDLLGRLASKNGF